jgi:tRNA(His) guanylyltransferase
MHDDLGDRIKFYESLETGRVLNSNQPIYARIDGRGFSKFTKGMNRPFDSRMSFAMIETAKKLAEKTNALVVFTQSDEISLAWSIDRATSPEAQVMFGAKVQKLNSILASLTTAIFMREVSTSTDSEFAAYADRLPHFDSRVYNIPNETEATNALIWREIDASRNAISMAAQHYYSHSSLQRMTTNAMLEKMRTDGNDFDVFPDYFKFGSYFVRKTVDCEVEYLGVVREVTRKKLLPADFSKLRSLSNREDVVFHGAESLLKYDDV